MAGLSLTAETGRLFIISRKLPRNRVIEKPAKFKRGPLCLVPGVLVAKDELLFVFVDDVAVLAPPLGIGTELHPTDLQAGA